MVATHSHHAVNWERLAKRAGRSGKTARIWAPTVEFETCLSPYVSIVVDADQKPEVESVRVTSVARGERVLS
jgi:hypothetical protein